MDKTLKFPYEAPGLDSLEVDLTGGGYCNSPGVISSESDEEYDYVNFNWK